MRLENSMYLYFYFYAEDIEQHAPEMFEQVEAVGVYQCPAPSEVKK